VKRPVAALLSTVGMASTVNAMPTLVSSAIHDVGEWR
jgi:hypothetical protein